MMNDANHSIVFFPGAGSYGAEFRLLMDALKPAAWIVRYPGRYGRDFGTPPGSFGGFVRACAEQIASRMPADPVLPEGPVLFGHSFGAYVAYATALRLQEAGMRVSALVAAGASAPRRLEVPERATGSPSHAAAFLGSVDPSALAAAPPHYWPEIAPQLPDPDPPPL